MRDNILISIITITYNSEKTLQQTIDSVRNQSYKNIEYIIIDGASTDATIDIIKNNSDIVTKWISEKDNGISDAFNKGIKIATGELIGFINSDDWYESDAITQVVKHYNNNTIICGNVKLWNNPTKCNIKKSSINRIKSEMTIWHPGMFCPKEIYNKLGTYDIHIKILMDYDFAIRCYLADINFKMVDKCLANMRFGGISNQLITKSMKESFDIKNKYFGRKAKHLIELLKFTIYYQFIILIKRLIYVK